MKIGILGYGNLGKGVECAIKQNKDCELVAVFTRRDPSTVKLLTQGVPVVKIDDILDYQDISSSETIQILQIYRYQKDYYMLFLLTFLFFLFLKDYPEV